MPRPGFVAPLGIALAAALLLTGCADPAADPAADLAGPVRLGDLASRNDPPIINTAVPAAPLLSSELPRHTGEPIKPGINAMRTPADVPAANPESPEPAKPPAAPPLLVPGVAQALVVPRDDPRVALTLTMLDDLELDPLLQHTWHQNGLRVGRIARSRLPLLLANLPKTLDVTIVQVQPAPIWIPVKLTEPLRGVTRVKSVDLTGKPRAHRLVNGEFQMLLKLAPALDGAGGMQLALVPFHHSNLPTIVPRDPGEKVLDGTRFDDLLIHRTLDPDDIWVFTARTPAEKDPARKPTGPKLPSLGESMFTGQRGSRPVQIILLVGLQK